MAKWRTILLFAAFDLMTHKLHNVQADCKSDIAAMEPVIPIPENSRAGAVIKQITTDYINLRHKFSASDGFVKIDKGSIIAKTDISLDGSQKASACAKSQETQPTVDLYCSNDIIKTTFNFFINFANNYGPYFTGSKTSVIESLPAGSTVIDLNTIVRDDDCTNSFNFYIDVKSKQFFKVVAPKLVLLQNLDYEAQKEHHINVTAISSIRNGRGSLANTTTLTIRVLDVDDMSPVFDISNFLLRLPERQDLSSTWFYTTPQIQARDGDVGINIAIVYSIQNVTPKLNLQINNKTGQLKVLEHLDREHRPAYTVIVKASQIDVAYRTATATMNLLVNDVNDNRPVFTTRPNVAIVENAPDESYVMELSGEDEDEGDNALFDFIITSDSVGAFKTEFQPTTNKSLLVVGNSTALRGQVQALVQFYLKERRPIVGPACTNTTMCIGRVRIDITDVNLNTPEFKSSSYTFTLPSNASGHYVIGQVSAVDRDRGDNGVVVYTFTPISSPSDCSSVTVNLTNGVLATDRQLPPGASCSWFITACDSPTESNTRRCSSVPLTVAVSLSGIVAGVNRITMPENVPIGTMVTHLSSKGLETTSTEFEIVADILYTRVLLDREIKDSYVVSITRGQNANPATIVHVNVIDVNDNAPVFGQSVYVINMDNSWKINQTVLQVNATDADIGLNAQLTFSMATGREYFTIDPTTGQVRLTNIPTMRDSEYHLLVTDSGRPSFSSMATLNVYNPVYNETATVLLPVNRNKLLADREGVVRILGLILGLNVRIYNIESLGRVADVGSKVYISATSPLGHPVSPAELNKFLDTHAVEIYQQFAKPPGGGENKDDRGLSVLEIVLICLASVLLLFLMLVAFLWYRSNKILSQTLIDSPIKEPIIHDDTPSKVTVSTNVPPNSLITIARTESSI